MTDLAEAVMFSSGGGAARVTHDAVTDEVLGAQLPPGRMATLARTLDQLASARNSAE